MSTQSHRSQADALPEFDDLKGMEVCDVNGETIGSVDGVYVEGDGTSDRMRYLSVKTGWFGSRSHVIPLDDVRASESGDVLVVPYGKDQLEGAPTYDAHDSIGGDDESRIYGYYGREGYWEAVRARQTTPSPTPEIAAADVAAAIDRGADPVTGEGGMDPDRTPDTTDRDDRGVTDRNLRRHSW